MITSKASAIAQTNEVLNARKLLAETKAENNFKRAMENNSFKTAYEKMSSLKWDIAKAEYKNENASKLKTEYGKQQKACEKILKTLNLTWQDFEPKYSCKHCNDTGVNNGKPCSCFKKVLSTILLQESGVNKNNTFKNANLNIWGKGVAEQNRILYDKMKTYSSDLSKTTKKILTLCGKTGVGKTHLAQCMVNESVSKGNFTLFISAFDLNQQFLKYHCSEVSEKEIVLEPILTCDLLVIDDLGTENILKNVTREYLYLVLSERLANNKNTVITTNFNIDQLDKVYDGRISSRLTDKRNAAILEMSGSDLRHKL